MEIKCGIGCFSRRQTLNWQIARDEVVCFLLLSKRANAQAGLGSIWVL
jgi:hypothetical protein